MAKIYLPGLKEYRDIDQIVAFGCSMTQGAELLDNFRYPTIPDVEGFKRSFNDVMDWHRYHNATNITVSPEEEEEIRNKERQMAWPGQLASLYDIPCYSYAEGGSSFEKQLTQFIDALSKNAITKKTLVVWGLTAKERGLWVAPNKMTTYMLNGIMDPPQLESSSQDFWYQHVNSDMMLLWKYYNCLTVMFSWASEYCNDQFLFVQGVGKNMLDKNCFNEAELKYLSETPEFLSTILNLQNMLEPKYNKYRIFKNNIEHCLFEWTGKFKDFRLSGSHPTLAAHIKYASLIKNELAEK